MQLIHITGADAISPPIVDDVVFITRYYPYPQRAGAWIYTAQMIALWARLARRVNVFCALPSRFAAATPEPAPSFGTVFYHFGETISVSASRYALSLSPKAAAGFATSANRHALSELLDRRRPNLIAIDHVGASWALPVIESLDRQRETKPILVYITHNYETSTRLSIAREARFPGAIAHLYDALQIRRRDQRLLRRADSITCNTQDDLLAYRQIGAVRGVVLPPVYTRAVARARRIDDAAPRKIVIVSSFLWSAKLLNLDRFLACSAPIITRHGIALHVVGRMRPSDLTVLKARYPGITFHGEVPSVEPYMRDARLGLLIDSAGGGFKHTALTYAFNRVPVAALRGALPPDLDGGACIVADTMGGLVDAASDAIDDLALLNRMQQALFEKMQPYLSSAENLHRLREEVLTLRSRSADVSCRA